MPEDDDYELLPHRALANIQREIDIVKQKASSNEETIPANLKSSIDSLSGKISNLISIFQEAAKSMPAEEGAGSSQKIDLLLKKMETLEGENRKIAEAILVVADLIKEMRAQPRPVPQMPRSILGQTPPPMQRPMPPRQEFQPMQQKQQMPGTPPGFRQISPMPPSPFGAPLPPPGPMYGPSPLPPLPDVSPKKAGLLSKFLNK
jgi:hypothetical protein